MKTIYALCALCVLIAVLDLWLTAEALDCHQLASWPRLRGKLTLDATLATLAIGAALCCATVLREGRQDRTEERHPAPRLQVPGHYVRRHPVVRTAAPVRRPARRSSRACSASPRG